MGGRAAARRRRRARLCQRRYRLRLPPWRVVPGLFDPYHRYHGFCAHEAPVPGPAVIMHCSNELKEQFRPPLRPV